MKVGISLRSSYTVSDVRQGARWMIERARAARESGLDSLFLGDHHIVPAPYYQNTPMLGRLLAEWDDNTAGALFLLPLWNPVLVAEHVGTLASIASGPFVMQCAIGAGRVQFAGMGASMGGRAARFEESLALIRHLWAGGDIDGARIAPLPPEPVEVWIGGHAPRAIDRAARLGDAWLAGPEATSDQARELADTYRERCAEHVRTPTAVAIRRDIHVGASDEDAHAVADPVLQRGYRGFDPAACVVGGPETVGERFAELAAMGYTDVIVRHLADEQTEVLRSLERLAQVRETVATA